MGRFCRICQRVRANEKFSGHGHRDHVCRDCGRLARAERDRLECLDEVDGFLAQSNISARNCERLKILCQHQNTQVRELAELIAGIVRVHPRKRLRVRNIARRYPPLFNRMVRLLGDGWWDGFWSDRMDMSESRLWERWQQAGERT